MVICDISGAPTKWKSMMSSVFFEEELMREAKKAEKVVRCGECVKYIPMAKSTGICGRFKAVNIRLGVAVIDYCSMGERKK